MQNHAIDDACPPRIRSLDRSAFLATVERTSRDAEESVKTARQLATWAVRLQPYFERNPELTVEQAHEAYLLDIAATDAGARSEQP